MITIAIGVATSEGSRPKLPSRRTRTACPSELMSPTVLDAARLNEQAKAAMDALPARRGIGAAHLETDYNFTDTATHRYRYQAVYRVVHGTI